MVRARREDCCVWPRCTKRVELPYHVYTKHFGFCDKHWSMWCDLPTNEAQDAKVREWFGPKVERASAKAQREAAAPVAAPPTPPPEPEPARARKPRPRREPPEPAPARIDASGWAVLEAALAAKKQEDG